MTDELEKTVVLLGDRLMLRVKMRQSVMEAGTAADADAVHVEGWDELNPGTVVEQEQSDAASGLHVCGASGGVF